MGHVDDGALREVFVIGGGREGDGISVGSATWVILGEVVRGGASKKKKSIKEDIANIMLPPAIGSPSAFLPRPQSNALSDPGGELSGQP